MQKAIILIIIVLSIGGAFIFLGNQGFGPKVQNNLESAEKTNQQTGTIGSPNPTPASLPSGMDSKSSEIILEGIFNIVYGDPQNGGTPRYRYSITDNSGKTTTVTISDKTKFVDGTSQADYDRKKVKITGHVTSSNLVEVLTIELK